MAILPQYDSLGWTEQSDRVLQQYLDLERYVLESGLDQDIDRAPLLNVS